MKNYSRNSFLLELTSLQGFIIDALNFSADPTNCIVKIYPHTEFNKVC